MSTNPPVRLTTSPFIFFVFWFVFCLILLNSYSADLAQAPAIFFTRYYGGFFLGYIVVMLVIAFKAFELRRNDLSGRDFRLTSGLIVMLYLPVVLITILNALVFVPSAEFVIFLLVASWTVNIIPLLVLAYLQLTRHRIFYWRDIFQQ